MAASEAGLAPASHLEQLESAMRSHHAFEARHFGTLATSAKQNVAGFVASVNPVSRLVGSGCVPLAGIHCEYAKGKGDDAALSRVTLVALPYSRPNIVPAPRLVLFDAVLGAAQSSGVLAFASLPELQV